MQAVVDWFGPISFLQRRIATSAPPASAARAPAAPAPYLSRYLGAPLATVPGRSAAADPITYLTPGDPPILIEHGTADGTVPAGQSTRLAEAYAARVGADAVTLNLTDGAGHVDPPSTTAHLDQVLDWLDARLE